MDKDEILRASRIENKNIVLLEVETAFHGSHTAMRVGTTVCALLAIVGQMAAHRILYGPWIIYFSMLCSYWFIRYQRMGKVSDLVVAIVFLVLSIVCFGLLVKQLMEINHG